MTAWSPYEMALVVRRTLMAPCETALAAVEADCSSSPVLAAPSSAARGKNAPKASLRSSSPEALLIRSHARPVAASRYPVPSLG